jgi:hypothetical protein
MATALSGHGWILWDFHAHTELWAWHPRDTQANDR